MSEPTDPRWDDSLRDYPEIAIEIAVFIGNFNALEAILHLAFSQMLGDGGRVTHCVLSPWNSFSQRLKIITQVCRLYPQHPNSVEILAKDAALRELNTFRNLLAHSAYSASKNNVDAISYIVSAREPKLTPITGPLLNENRKKYKLVRDALVAVITPSTGEDRHIYSRPA